VKLRRRLTQFLVTFLIAYVVALLLIRLFESHLVFFPNIPGRLDGDWSPAGLGVEDVWLTTTDGVKLHAWWIQRSGADFTFLAFHGNAANIANRADVYRFLAETPANVLAVEYRGYGKSQGSPSESGIYRDAQAGYEFLLRPKGIRPGQIVSFGQSLGTAVAANLASERQVAALILEAPFPSASAVARKAFWFLPGVSLLTYGQFATGKAIQRVSAPVMIVHCKQDPVIPVAMGRQVFAAVRSPKVFLEINDECHEEASLLSPVKYRAALNAFLRSLPR
jgi:fermentation-respiration switch protein FrsA (DUF1100 family)